MDLAKSYEHNFPCCIKYSFMHFSPVLFCRLLNFARFSLHLTWIIFLNNKMYNFSPVKFKYLTNCRKNDDKIYKERSYLKLKIVPTLWSNQFFLYLFDIRTNYTQGSLYMILIWLLFGGKIVFLHKKYSLHIVINPLQDLTIVYNLLLHSLNFSSHCNCDNIWSIIITNKTNKAKLVGYTISYFFKSLWWNLN